MACGPLAPRLLAQRLVGPAVVAGVGVGALATYPYWGDYGYDNGCWTYEPAYDAFGNYLGQQYVNICY